MAKPRVRRLILSKSSTRSILTILSTSTWLGTLISMPMPRLVQSNWCRPSTPARLMMTSLVISIRRLTTLRLTASSHMSSRSFQKKTIRLPSATRPLRESLRMLPSEWRQSSTKRLGRQQRQKRSPAVCIIRQLGKTRLVSW